MDLEMMKSLFSATVGGESSEQPGNSRKQKKILAQRKNRALNNVMRDDSHLNKIMGEAEEMKRLMAENMTDGDGDGDGDFENSNTGERPQSEPGKSKKNSNSIGKGGEGGKNEPKRSKKRSKKEAQLASFRSSLQAQPRQRVEKVSSGEIPSVYKVVQNTKVMSLKEFQLVELKFKEVMGDTAEMVGQLLGAFRYYDVDNSGSITTDEALVVLSNNEIELAEGEVDDVIEKSKDPEDEGKVKYEMLNAKVMKRLR